MQWFDSIRRSALIFGILAVSAASPAWGGEPKPPLALAPSSPWNVDYADDYCRLARKFGTGKQSTMLWIDRFAPSEEFRLNFAGMPFKYSSPDGRATVRFGTVLPEQKLTFFAGSIGKDRPAWVFGSAVRIRPASDTEPDAAGDADQGEDTPSALFSEADEASVTDITIGRPLRRPIVLKTGSMAAPFAALRTCTDELLAHWGIDVARHRKATRLARPLESPGRWMNRSDYPSGMLADFQPGLVQFRLIVGGDGAVQSCHIQQSTHPDGFDKAVCKALMRRARFEPALDKDGRPMTSYYRNLVRFQIP